MVFVGCSFEVDGLRRYSAEIEAAEADSEETEAGEVEAEVAINRIMDLQLRS